MNVGPVNLLLESLPHRERGLLLGCCNPVDLVIGDVLCEYKQPFQHVYFPMSGMISVVTKVIGHPPLEIALIGNEGMLGVELVLGVNNSPLHGVVQGPGTALRMAATEFQHEIRRSPIMLRRFNRHLHSLMAQLPQSVACVQFHEVGIRLARWLLMLHDRAQSDRFYVTHQNLADMLGVQRSAVTIAAGLLQKKNLISYSRGEISIIDRNGLEAASCECYAKVNDYRRSLLF